MRYLFFDLEYSASKVKICEFSYFVTDENLD